MKYNIFYNCFQIQVFVVFNFLIFIYFNYTHTYSIRTTIRFQTLKRNVPPRTNAFI